MKQLDWLAKWWYVNSEGAGEYSKGVLITTLDNPGWMIDIDLRNTPLLNTAFQEIDERFRSEYDWAVCKVKDLVFVGRCGPHNLSEIFDNFQKWAERNVSIGSPSFVDFDQFDWLSRWYHSMCDGQWEHGYGVTITTLDKPGWRVSIDLTDTPLAEVDFLKIDERFRSDHDWVDCNVNKEVFIGEGGRENLSEIFEIFRKWVDDNTTDWPSNSIEHIHEFFALRDGYKSGENKNVLEQCANILAEREDQLLLPDSSGLLKWLRDLSWPGARTILERLMKMSASPMFVYEVKSCIKEAIEDDDQTWLANLSRLLDNESLNERLPEETLAVLKKHYGHSNAS